eukprot:9383136-Pyramimonas_sp.AAC.1
MPTAIGWQPHDPKDARGIAPGHRRGASRLPVRGRSVGRSPAQRWCWHSRLLSSPGPRPSDHRD